MPRRYACTFNNVTVTAAQDLIAMKGASGKTCMLARVWFGMTNTTLQTAQGLEFGIKFGSATVTLGSGGGSVTPTKYDPGDAAASFTCRRNDTVKATTAGAFTNLVSSGGHNYGGFAFNFGKDGPVFGPDQGIVFELLSTVTGTCAFSGGAEVVEWG